MELSDLERETLKLISEGTDLDEIVKYLMLDQRIPEDRTWEIIKKARKEADKRFANDEYHPERL